MARLEVTYEFYTDVYKGSTIPDSAFEREVMMAEAFVSQITFGRIRKYDLNASDLEAVRMAICAVAEEQYDNKLLKIATAGRPIKTETTDGYAVTYESKSAATPERMIKICYAAAKVFLSATTLMYRGTDYDYEQ
ncbi:MAG: hypothetical protein ACK5MN_12325 [Lachnospiraceae bacterium]